MPHDNSIADFPLILGSSSAYRREMLSRLGVPFTQASPNIDEAARTGESHPALAKRLASAKAHVIASAHPNAWVIGSDQVASLDGTALGKPGDIETAQQQLAACSGKTVRFITAISLVRAQSDQELTHVDVTRVRFRDLSAADIDAYLAAEAALDCAGSFKSEGRGITLVEGIYSDDPTALVGLPMIATARLLRATGLL